MDEEDASSPTIVEESASFQENRQTYVPRTLQKVKKWVLEIEKFVVRAAPAPVVGRFVTFSVKNRNF